MGYIKNCRLRFGGHAALLSLWVMITAKRAHQSSELAKIGLTRSVAPVSIRLIFPDIKRTLNEQEACHAMYCLNTAYRVCY